jgi:hypothetical protein
MVLHAPSTPLRLEERPLPRPGPGEVLLRVHACGVCRTDLHIVDGELAEPAGVARHLQRPITDQPGAQQGRDMHVVEGSGQRKAVALVGDRLLGEAAVDVVPGESRGVAEVLAPAATVRAVPAGPREPGDSHPVADGRPRRRASAVPGMWALGDDRAHDLVSEDERELGLGQLAVDDVQVGAADPAGLDCEQQLPGSRDRFGQLGERQRLARPLQHHGLHFHKNILRPTN